MLCETGPEIPFGNTNCVKLEMIILLILKGKTGTCGKSRLRKKCFLKDCICKTKTMLYLASAFQY